MSHMLMATTVILVFAYCATAQKPVIDCSKIRGVCYNPKPEATVRKELAYGARVGLNTVRFWLNPSQYAKQGNEYVKQVVDFVRVIPGRGPKKSRNLIAESCCFCDSLILAFVWFRVGVAGNAIAGNGGVAPLSPPPAEKTSYRLGPRANARI